MALCLYTTGGDRNPHLGWIENDRVVDIAGHGGPSTLAAALGMPASDLRAALEGLETDSGTPVGDVTLLAPIDDQEVWAAGVTYLQSRDARMEEAREKSIYDRVYEADRPELFLKATRSRVSDPGEPIGVRGDSTWDVPEPECALVINSEGDIVGYTIGNDVSSRSIEGENPLYLPQAKVFDKGASLGPAIAMSWEIADPRNLPIRLTIRRGGEVAFDGETNTNRLHRTFEDLRDWLFRHNTFAAGAILMTGTGVVPPSEFSLDDGDEVEITIEGIGTLTNPVVRLA